MRRRIWGQPANRDQFVRWSVSLLLVGGPALVSWPGCGDRQLGQPSPEEEVEPPAAPGGAPGSAGSGTSAGSSGTQTGPPGESGPSVPSAEGPGHAIIVNSAADGSLADGRITLRMALEQAAADSRPNAVRFDPLTFDGSVESLVRPRATLVLDGPGDWIDGRDAAVAISGSDLRSASAAVLLLGASGAVLRDVRIEDVTGSPILVDVTDGGTMPVIVRGCHLADCTLAGIYVRDAGGGLVVTETTFSGVGADLIAYEDAPPLPPFPVVVRQGSLTGRTGPGAAVELFRSSNLEADSFLGRVRADASGRFTFDAGTPTPGVVTTASSRLSGGSTSTFVPVAGSRRADVAAALLADTGPTAEEPSAMDAGAVTRRWATGTRLVFHVVNPIDDDLDTAAALFADSVLEITGGALSADARFGARGTLSGGDALIEVRYLAPSDSALGGAAGQARLQITAEGEIVGAAIMLASNLRRPGVVLHEMGHTLGLSHVCVSGVSMMVTSACQERVGDDSALVMPDVPTFYDVDALAILYDPRVAIGTTLDRLQALGLVR